MTRPHDRARRPFRAPRKPSQVSALRAAIEPLEHRLLLCVFHEAGGTDFKMSLLGASPMGPTVTSSPTAARVAPSLAVNGTTAAISGTGATVSLSAPTTWPTAASGLPILNSLPGAPTAVYLDFDGDGSNTPYSEDADSATYNATEQTNIVEAWRQIATYFAMFDTNVTTQVTTLPKAWDVIGNNAGGATGGYAFVGTFPNSSANAFNTSSNARTRQSGMAHEIGHVFGLWHQSTYDALGNKTNEYLSAPDPLHGPIMGVDYSGTVHKWYIGHSSSSAGTLQDDVAIIADRIKAYEPAGGDGFRPDDFGNTTASATPLADDGAGNLSASGIIERMSDVDAFSFVAPGGSVAVAAVPSAPSGLDAKLDVFDALGNRVATADATTNDQHLTLALPAGTYYALVSSHGDYADLGTYDLTVHPLPAGNPPPPTYNNLPAPTNLAAAPAPTGTGVALAWDDVPGSTGFVVQRSPDGVTFAQVGTTAAGVTSYTDPNPGASQRYFYRVAARDASSNTSIPSAAASTVNRPGPVTGLSVIAWSTTSLIVNWKDVSGDTGYRLERSSDGGATFAPVATLAANVPSYTDSGLTSGAPYVYRVVTLSPAGDSAPSATVTGAPRLQAVTGAAIASAAPNSVALRWTDLSNETGYRVDRSTNGTTWSTVGTLAANATSFVDSTVSPLAEYYYRVYGTIGTAVSMDPSPTYTATPAAAALPAPWTAADLGTVYGGGGTGASGYSGGTFTLIAAGSDIGGTADSFRYTYQPLNGDGDIIARVASIENTNASAKVAVMIRASLAAGAQNVAVVLTPGSGVQVLTRSANNASTTASMFSGIIAPYWIRLKRAYNSATGQYTLTGYDSADGVTWTQLGNALTLNMPASAYIGLGTTSRDTTKLMTASVTNVTVANTFPSIATPAAANPAAPTADQFALSVLGNDDHGESNLTYTWAATRTPAGAKAPTFAANGTNAAKNTTATVFAPGTYQFTVTITDASGLSTTSVVSVTVPTSAFPAVTAVTYDYRQTFAVTFNTDVGASLTPDDLAVRPRPSGTARTPDGVQWNATTRTATFWFNAPLPNGDYRATLAAAGVYDTATVHPLADTPYDFFVLAGDANRDRTVNFDDLLVLAKNYNASPATWSQGDFNGDGTVNNDDLLILAKDYNVALPAPAPAAPSASALPATTSTDTVSPALAAVDGGDDTASPAGRPSVLSVTPVTHPAKPKALKPAKRPK